MIIPGRHDRQLFPECPEMRLAGEHLPVTFECFRRGRRGILAIVIALDVIPEEKKQIGFLARDGIPDRLRLELHRTGTKCDFMQGICQ